MTWNEARLALNAALAILAMIALRLIAAAYTPITFDEAYYWMWSKNLAGDFSWASSPRSSRSIAGRGRSR